MNENEKFDNVIKNTLSYRASKAEKTRDIFECAWNNNRNEERKMKYKMLNMKKSIIAAALGIAIIGTSASFAPEVRAAVKTFFNIDGNGKIIEETETDEGGLSTTLKLNEKNKEVMEKFLGFKITYPEEIGKYYNGTDKAIPGVSIGNIKHKDEGKIYNELKDSKDYKKTFDELSKNYKNITFKFYVLTQYIDDESDYIFGVDKCYNTEKLDLDSKETFDIEGIKCGIYTSKGPKYNVKVTKRADGSICGIEDITTQKPNGIRENSYIKFSYGDIIYTISGGAKTVTGEVVDNNTIEFAKEYIKYLKNNN